MTTINCPVCGHDIDYHTRYTFVGGCCYECKLTPSDIARALLAKPTDAEIAAAREAILNRDGNLLFSQADDMAYDALTAARKAHTNA